MYIFQNKNITLIKNVYLYIILILANFCWGQDAVYFDHISTNDGLSQSDINDMYQDPQGFMWFGTHDGLNKYDGYKFTVYKPNVNKPGSISSNLVFSIAGDKEGNLWIGTTGSGLNYFDRTTETFTQFKSEKDNLKSLSNNHVTKVFLDSKNRLWVGTSSGLNMMDISKPKDSLVFHRLSLDLKTTKDRDDNNITAIYEDAVGQIWVGSNMGLYKLSRDENGFVYFPSLNTTMDVERIPIRDIYEDKNNRLIIATGNGIFMQPHDKNSFKLNRIYNGSFEDILLDNNNNIYIGSSKGLLFFDNSNIHDYPKFVKKFAYDPTSPSKGLTKNIVKSLFLDKTGIIWVGTNGGGLNKFDPDRKHFRHIKRTLDPTSLSYDKIRSIYEDSNNTLWIGTEGGGLNMLTEKNDKGEYTGFKSFDKVIKAFAITEVEMYGKKTLLVGAENVPSLFKIDISRPNDITENHIEAIDKVNRSVFSLLEDTNKNIWIGTYGAGIVKWMPNEKTKTYDKLEFSEDNKNMFSISNGIIRNIYEDKKGDIWFATAGGLNRLDKSEINKNNPKFEVYKNRLGDSSTISHNYILSLYESSKGELWIGTFGGGLNKFIPSKNGNKGTFISFSETDGLPNNVIKGILEDNDGYLWLSTNQGLSRFDPVNKTFKNYDVNDGLQSNEFQELACLKRKNGEMLFGGINGFNSFYPNDITDNVFEAQTMITEFSISNKSVEIGEEVNGKVILKNSINNISNIDLKFNQNSFSFEFAALHYAAPLKNQFAYRLQGFDKEWIYTSVKKRFATYTNMEPGNYVFEVKASNNDGIWDSTPATLGIKIIPPFYRTNFAYFIYSLLLLGLLATLWRYTIISTTKKHQLELEHVEKEKIDELQRIKLEFFTNISHEFRTPLTLIKGPLEYLQKKGSSIGEVAVQEQYGLMSKNTSYLLRLVNQLLDFRKINQGKMRLVVRNSDIVSFIKEVGEPFQFLARKKSIHFNIETSKESIISWFDHDALEKIMNNLLSNAFKFTPDKGTITVKISEDRKINTSGLLKGKQLLVDSIVIEVKDSGPGIAENKKDSIFERFYIEKEDQAKNPEGVGIGLSFTKSLIELHQGNVQVRTNVEQGTSFFVQLPMEKSAYENVPEISCKEEFDNDFLVRSSESESFAIDINDELEDHNISNSRSKLPVLLIVDDNQDIRNFIKQALGDTYTIYDAENGQQGLEIAMRIIPNVVLTDVVMPIMDGIELCSTLKVKKETSHIPVLMLTAKSSDESKLEGLSIGADDYISKPFSMDMLKLKLANLIKSREELRKLFNRDISLNPTEVTVTSADETFLQHAMDIVEKHMMNTDFSVEMMVKEMGMSRSNLYLKFKELTGLSSSEFIRNIRLKRAMQLLTQSDLSVKEIMYMTGFNTASYFSKCFKKQFGVIPSEYVKQLSISKKQSNF